MKVLQNELGLGEMNLKKKQEVAQSLKKFKD